MTDMAAPAGNRTLAAAGAILIYALVIGFTDNYVRVIADQAGLWQFHATRTAMALVLVALAAPLLGLRLRPVNLRAVTARSAIHGTAMLIYFGCVAFLPVAVVAAGLFTAPIFVLLISRFVYGMAIGPVRVAAVVLGFAGVLLVLGPGSGAGAGAILTPLSVLPMLAGFLYAVGNIATRQWCAGESAEVLTLGFFLAVGLAGLAGMALLALWPQPVPEGAAGFILRGAVWPGREFLFWTFVQAAGSLFGVAMMVRAYQMAEASRVSIFEYVILPCAAGWTWLLWGEALAPQAILGIVLIVAAGVAIALRGR